MNGYEYDLLPLSPLFKPLTSNMSTSALRTGRILILKLHQIFDLKYIETKVNFVRNLFSCFSEQYGKKHTCMSYYND